MSALQRYANAQQLTNSLPLNGGMSQKKSGEGEMSLSSSSNAPSFKETLSTSSASHGHGLSVLKQLKQSGNTAEKDALHQIMGVGNLEKTAVSMEAAKTYLEVVSHILRMSVDKITELTTRTMGG